jgi:hypothetical protein
MMPAHRLYQPSARRIVGFENLSCRAQQTALIFFGCIGEKLSIFGDRLE